MALFNKITIIGMGLIGGSIARAASEKHLAQHITACDPNELSLAYAKKHAFATTTTTDPAQAVQGSQLVIIASPPSTLEEVAQAIAPALEEGAIVMDVCSIKLSAIAAIQPNLPPHAHYIPAHPIAGSEHSGISASNSQLFNHKRIVLTPETPETTLQLEQAMRFWQGIGAMVEAMPPHLHDLIYAYVSHLPQLLAFAAAHPLEGHAPEAQNISLAKFLRLSHSNTEMWVDIFLLNRTNLLSALDRYLDAVLHICSELKSPPETVTAVADELAARTVLFPRIAAACLITTVMEAEKKAGFPFARYAGTGFADFTYPAAHAPDEDLETISQQYLLVRAVLLEYVERLKHFRAAIASGNEDDTSLALAEG